MMCFDSHEDFSQVVEIVQSNIDQCLAKSSKLKCRPEQSSINSVCNQAQTALNGEKSAEFTRDYVKSSLFLSEKVLPLQIIDSATRILSKQFNIPTSRTFIKHKETQRLVLALYYNSWMPFLKNITVEKKKKQFTISFQSITYVNKYDQEVTINEPFNETFSFTTKTNPKPQQHVQLPSIHTLTNFPNILSFKFPEIPFISA